MTAVISELCSFDHQASQKKLAPPPTPTHAKPTPITRLVLIFGLKAFQCKSRGKASRPQGQAAMGISACGKGERTVYVINYRLGLSFSIIFKTLAIMVQHRKYARISLQKREEFVELVLTGKMSVINAAKRLRLKLSTAKLILKRFKQTGGFFIKKHLAEPLRPQAPASSGYSEEVHNEDLLMPQKKGFGAVQNSQTYISFLDASYWLYCNPMNQLLLAPYCLPPFTL